MLITSNINYFVDEVILFKLKKIKLIIGLLNVDKINNFNINIYPPICG